MNPFYFKNYATEDILWFLLLLTWTLFWKGYALWLSARKEERGWFFALLVLNKVGILEIIYIFGVAKKKWSDVTALFKKRTLSSEPTQ